MAIEPNNALPAPEPSNGSAPADGRQLAVPASESASPSAEERPSWWTRLVSRGNREAAPPESEPGQEPGTANGTSARPVTPEELSRQVQAEVDRREAKRQADAAAAERRRLRDTDPYRYAKQERDEEQQTAARADSEQAFNGLFRDIGAHHDRVSLDPIVLSLDEQERARIMAMPGAGEGLDGRRLIVTESLKALEKRWKAEGAAEAERRLRRNSTFRKQVYADYRGREPEPDLLPATDGRGVDEGSVSGLMRSFYGIRPESG